MYFFFTLFSFILFHIDICYSSISAKSTLVGVRKIIGPDRRESICCLSRGQPHSPSLPFLFPTRYCFIDFCYDHSHCYWYVLLQYKRHEHPGRCDVAKLRWMVGRKRVLFGRWQCTLLIIDPTPNYVFLLRSYCHSPFAHWYTLL